MIRNERTTTKMRVVFDASCNTNGLSLNECLYSGPNLLGKIFDILLRFRMNKIVILADIKQAFLNISIYESHRDFLRFLWRTPQGNLIIYRFCRVVFGLTSSPFLLNGTIRHHLIKYQNDWSEFAAKFLRDLYVDDSTTGCETVAEGIEFFEKAKSVMSEAGFELRKWCSNNVELQEHFDGNKKCENELSGDDQTFVESQLGTQGEFKRVLGIEWDSESDDFIFRFTEFIEKGRSMKLTKRNILSLSSTLYDPLGMISPITARVKTIFQIICKEKYKWDETIHPDIAKVWDEFLSALENVHIIKFRRYAFTLKNLVTRVELHGFCDSSKLVYCAVIYLRVISQSGTNTFFLTAKNKVAPLKEISIPRLELLGCVLLANLIQDVRSALDSSVVVNETFCRSALECSIVLDSW